MEFLPEAIAGPIWAGYLLTTHLQEYLLVDIIFLALLLSLLKNRMNKLSIIGAGFSTAVLCHYLQNKDVHIFEKSRGQGVDHQHVK